MDNSGKTLLSLMFNPGETICVSPNSFGYHSIPLQNALSDTVTLVPTQESLLKRNLTLEQGIEKIDSSKLLLCALNPIKGFRTDSNCTAFRNFLVEMDYGPIPAQLEYVKKIGIPYSAIIFSGNKSLHVLISLENDLPSEKIYRSFSEWILGAVPFADQKTKNPSRSIRIPGAYRPEGKRQELVEFKGKVSIKTLMAWLSLHPDAQPKKKERRVISNGHDFSLLKPWVTDRLINGLDPTKGRNQQWFAIAVEFALAGYEEDDALDILEGYFTPDNDFKESEWKTCIRSGFKYTYDRDGNG